MKKYIISKRTSHGIQMGQTQYFTREAAEARMAEMKAKGHKNLFIEEISDILGK